MLLYLSFILHLISYPCPRLKWHLLNRNGISALRDFSCWLCNKSAACRSVRLVGRSAGRNVCHLFCFISIRYHEVVESWWVSIRYERFFSDDRFLLLKTFLLLWFRTYVSIYRYLTVSVSFITHHHFPKCYKTNIIGVYFSRCNFPPYTRSLNKQQTIILYLRTTNEYVVTTYII